MLLLVYKYMCSNCPEYLRELLVHYQLSYSLHSSSDNLMLLRLGLLCSRAYVMEQFASTIKESKSVASFKKNLMPY